MVDIKMIAHWSQLTGCDQPPLSIPLRKNTKIIFFVISGRHRFERSADDSGTDKR